jgi:hypothetical protein
MKQLLQRVLPTFDHPSVLGTKNWGGGFAVIFTMHVRSIYLVLLLPRLLLLLPSWKIVT